MIKKLIIVFAGILLVFSSCYNQKEELLYPDGINCNGVDAKFTVDVSPIIQSRCATVGCHEAGSGNGPGALTDYDKIRNAANQIKPAITSRIMPKGSTLSTDEIKKIICWINSGAPNN